MQGKSPLESQIDDWLGAGLIDAGAAERIRAFESGRSRRTSLQWPIYLALGFGGLLIAAGVILFVAAHWDTLSPTERFTLVVAMVATFHILGAGMAERFPPLATTFHAIGTAALGAGIFLAAQIFNLRENWPNGVLLWALGAAAAYLLLRDWVQAGYAALLVPAWLISQWMVTADGESGAAKPLALGLIATALTYLSARTGDPSDSVRRALEYIGGLALFPCVLIAIFTVREDFGTRAMTAAAAFSGWAGAVVLPFAIAWSLRGTSAWADAVGTAWAFAVVESSAQIQFRGSGGDKHFLAIVILYLLCGLGAAGMVLWGLQERRKERVNLGVAGFALTVLFFYFDGFADKIGRSASLLVLGILCLAGGWLLERARRRLVARMEAA